MTHARQQIRDRIAGTTLASLAPSTGADEIYRSRSRPITRYPSIAVYNSSERLEVENPGYITGGIKRYRRFFSVVIEISVKTNAAPDSELDALCVLVEEAMAGDDNMGGGVIATDLTSTQFLREETSEEAIHVCRMVYVVEFRTASDDVETFLM